MGVMSRRVVPVCGNLCFCCPSLRPRSRQPVKRYKKMLAEIFPRNQDAEPNDRKIGKLCAYASKNPLRIPKVSKDDNIWFIGTHVTKLSCIGGLRDVLGWDKSASYATLLFSKVKLSSAEKIEDDGEAVRVSVDEHFISVHIPVVT